jgi:predicted membrane channel-forming protein YqfA (hemolysin III family)
MLTILSFALCNAHVRAYSSACWEVVVGGRPFVSIMVYVLFGCLSIISYPTLAVEVVETFVELLSINQVRASGMVVSRM